MQALTQNLGAAYGAKFGTIQSYKVAAAVHIYRFAAVVLRDDGFLYPAVEDISDTYKQLVVGLAQEEIDNTLGANGAKKCRVRREGRVIRQCATTVVQSLIGKLACLKNDVTVQKYTDSSGQVVMGRITELYSSTEVFVDLVDRPKRIATDIND
jgi:hypothetical protein